MIKGYEKYKKSGIEWMGEIPDKWEIVKLRYLCKITTGNKDTENREEDGLYPFYVRSQTVERISTYSFDGEAILTAGDGVGVCKVWHYVNEKFDFHQRVYMMCDFENIKGEFLYFFLKENFIHEVLKLSAKSTVDSLRRPMFLDFSVAIPSISEQIKIVEYLNHQTQLIDQLITKKEKLVQLLQEQRQAIINEAVTKGLDSNVKMKESGIECLGEIPKKWELLRLRYLGDCQNGVSKGREYFGSGHPFVNYSDVYKNMELPKKVKGLAKSTDLDKDNYSVEEGDVFFTRTSETVEEIGIASTCMQTIDNAVFAGFLIRFRPNSKKIFKGYSKYYFRSNVPRVFFVREMNLVTRASLSQELLKRLPVCLPPMNIQFEIAEFLDKKCSILDKIIFDSMESITKLKSYRQSLISEAVTGKIDLRDWQALTTNAE